MARYMADLQRLPDLAEAALADKETIQYFRLPVLQRPRHVLSSAGNVDYAASLEASLEAEGDQLHPLRGLHRRRAEARPPSPCWRRGTLVIAIATYEKLFDKMMTNVREVKARGRGGCWGITVRGREEALKQETDYQFCVPDITRLYAASVFEHPAPAAVRLLRGQHEGAADIGQAQEPGQVRHRWK